MNALETRAELLGIEEEIADYVRKVNNEIDDANISKDITSKNLNAIIDIITAKEQEIADKKKAEQAA